MNHDLAIALISAGIGAGSTLAGVALTSLFDTKRRAEERRDRARLEQREAVIEVLDAGRVWAAHYEPLTLATGVISDPVQLTELDTFKEFGPINVRYRRALVAARLIVEEPRVIGLVAELSLLVEGVEKISGPIFDEATKRGRATTATIGAGLKYVDDVRKKLVELEAAALDAFSADR